MKTVIMLSLGMLNQEVDTNKFIAPLLKVVKEQNPDFAPNLQALAPAFTLAAQFNKGEIKPEQLKEGMLSLFHVTMQDEEFWNLWNAMITVGDGIKETLDKLKAFSQAENTAICFYSDTNMTHLQFIQAQLQSKGLDLDFQSALMQLEGFVLYPSCHFGQEKIGLIQAIKTKIDEDKDQQAEKILLILGDPKNLDSPAHQAKVVKETQMIQDWAQANKVEVVLHAKAHSLLETLNNAIQLVETNQQSAPTFNA
jgi:hypothetical protein